MMTFSRNKLVGIECPNKDTFLVHGVLDDNIYGMEIDMEVRSSDFEITGIDGRIKRFTNPECPLSVPKLQNAIGLQLTQEDLASKVNRVVGRQGCRHFANLLLECADAVMQMAVYGEWQAQKKEGAVSSENEFLRKQLNDIPSLQGKCMAYSSIGVQT
ncbi:MAG: DUF2889 domain-containing protein [Chloroflexota bacterium]|nr:DUF2889 domain-containing protein [Chloroflexota bacterium]